MPFPLLPWRVAFLAFVALIGTFSCHADELPGLSHRIMVGSCSNPNRGGEIFTLIQDQHPDQLIFLGDQIYADREITWQPRKGTPELIAREYVLLTALPEWQALLASVDHKWMAVYDDHDYGNNNGDRTFAHRNVSIDLFRQFASHQPHQPDGVYSAHTVSVSANFKYKVILLDTRSNKDPEGTPEGDFLGPTQWAWLVDQLSPEALQGISLVFLASPIQVLSDDKLFEESWAEFPTQRDNLLKRVVNLSKTGGPKVFLLSGDVHSAEISQAICGDVMVTELTSSGLSHTLAHQAYPGGVRSHGWWFDWLSALYQVAHPAHYRMHKFADTYRYIHFALLDLYLDDSGDGVTGKIVFRVINYKGNEVVTREFPFSSPSASASSGSASAGACLPIHGLVPWWREQLAKALVLLYVCITVLTPCGLLLYGVFISLFYLCVGKEVQRRQKVEEQYQKMNKDHNS